MPDHLAVQFPGQQAMADHREDYEWHLHQEAVEILNFNGAELAQVTGAGISNTQQSRKVKLHFRVNLSCRFRVGIILVDHATLAPIAYGVTGDPIKLDPKNISRPADREWIFEFLPTANTNGSHRNFRVLVLAMDFEGKFWIAGRVTEDFAVRTTVRSRPRTAKDANADMEATAEDDDHDEEEEGSDENISLNARLDSAVEPSVSSSAALASDESPAPKRARPGRPRNASISSFPMHCGEPAMPSGPLSNLTHQMASSRPSLPAGRVLQVPGGFVMPYISYAAAGRSSSSSQSVGVFTASASSAFSAIPRSSLSSSAMATPSPSAYVGRAASPAPAAAASATVLDLFCWAPDQVFAPAGSSKTGGRSRTATAAARRVNTADSATAASSSAPMVTPVASRSLVSSSFSSADGSGGGGFGGAMAQLPPRPLPLQLASPASMAAAEDCRSGGGVLKRSRTPSSAEPSSGGARAARGGSAGASGRSSVSGRGSRSGATTPRAPTSAARSDSNPRSRIGSGRTSPNASNVRSSAAKGCGRAQSPATSLAASGISPAALPFGTATATKSARPPSRLNQSSSKSSPAPSAFAPIPSPTPGGKLDARQWELIRQHQQQQQEHERLGNSSSSTSPSAWDKNDGAGDAKVAVELAAELQNDPIDEEDEASADGAPTQFLLPSTVATSAFSSDRLPPVRKPRLERKPDFVEFRQLHAERELGIGAGFVDHHGNSVEDHPSHPSGFMHNRHSFGSTSGGGASEDYAYHHHRAFPADSSFSSSSSSAPSALLQRRFDSSSSSAFSALPSTFSASSMSLSLPSSSSSNAMNCHPFTGDHRLINGDDDSSISLKLNGRSAAAAGIAMTADVPTVGRTISRNRSRMRGCSSSSASTPCAGCSECVQSPQHSATTPRGQLADDLERESFCMDNDDESGSSSFSSSSASSSSSACASGEVDFPTLQRPVAPPPPFLAVLSPVIGSALSAASSGTTAASTATAATTSLSSSTSLFAAPLVRPSFASKTSSLDPMNVAQESLASNGLDQQTFATPTSAAAATAIKGTAFTGIVPHSLPLSSAAPSSSSSNSTRSFSTPFCCNNSFSFTSSAASSRKAPSDNASAITSPGLGNDHSYSSAHSAPNELSLTDFQFTSTAKQGGLFSSPLESKNSPPPRSSASATTGAAAITIASTNKSIALNISPKA